MENTDFEDSGGYCNQPVFGYILVLSLFWHSVLGKHSDKIGSAGDSGANTVADFLFCDDYAQKGKSLSNISRIVCRMKKTVIQ